MSARIAPYGTWKSPITSDLIVADSIGLAQPLINGEDIYWIEMRPTEDGRNVVVRRDAQGKTNDVTPAGFNARTRVHEYGGGDYTVHQHEVYFSNFADQRIYRQRQDETPNAITPPGAFRYADLQVDARRQLLVAVREDHTSGKEPVNTLVILKLNGEDHPGQVIVFGNDFYSSPRLSPDGRQLAWLTWNHPNMPWDGTELWVAQLNEDGQLASSKRVAGGIEESIFQPEWSPGGTLYFVSDRNDWWNFYRLSTDGTIEAVLEMEAEFGTPQWVFGMSSYGFADEETIYCAYVKDGVFKLAELNTLTKALRPIDVPFSDVRFVRVRGDKIVARVSTPADPPAIVRIDGATGATEVLRRSMELELDQKYISLPRNIEFPTEDGLTAYGFFYSPANSNFEAPSGERPPLLVKIHGGPTAAATPGLVLGIQYWTSRGFAVLDVNYGGSTGFGRAFRERLKGKWGVVDMNDCANGARYLVEGGEVDGQRLMITGESAGGYTTLCALTFGNTFNAGGSHFGVSDIEALAQETHKFESRYLDRLIGPYPEARDLYRERSPINAIERLSCPVIFFQGLDDKVVPPNQAEMMVHALRTKGIPVAYVAFEGEQHGFRQAKNIKRALDGELYFYSRVFGFEPADEIEALKIENL